MSLAPRRARHRLSSIAAVTVLTLAVAAWAAPGVARAGDALRVSSSPAASSASLGPSATQLASELKTSIAAKRYPTALAPVPGKGPAPQILPSAQCLNPDDIFNVDKCNYGPPNLTKNAVVLGDSVSSSILPGVIDALVPLGYHIHGLALPGCPVAYVQVKLSFDPAAAKRCNDDHLLLYAQVQRLHPDLLILTDSANGMQRLASGARKEAEVTEWVKGERIALHLLQAPGRRIVILAPNPTAANPATCVTPGSTPAACLYTVDPWWFGKQRAERKVAAEVGATYVDTLSWYAVGKTVPLFAGTTTMRWDGSHITAAYSHKLAGLLRSALLGTTS